MDIFHSRDEPSDDEQEQIRTFPEFLGGEWAHLWPVWMLGLIFALAIGWFSLQ